MNQFQPPPRPPQALVKVDPLMALSATKPSSSVSEELTDLSDEDMEEWASGGTRILTKPTPTTTMPTVHQAPNHPSYYPVSLPSVPPRPAQKSHIGLWLALASVLVLIFGVVAAAIGLIVYRAHEDEVAAAAVTVAPPPPVETAAAVTAPPLVTATPTATANANANANANAHAAPTATTRSALRAPAAVATGILRTFAAGTGKPISVDGRQIGYGGSGPTTTCGKHSIAVGTGRARTYDVPCNGSITVGSPDGN